MCAGVRAGALRVHPGRASGEGEPRLVGKKLSVTACRMLQLAVERECE